MSARKSCLLPSLSRFLKHRKDFPQKRSIKRALKIDNHTHTRPKDRQSSPFSFCGTSESWEAVMAGLFDLEKNFAFYKAYHRNSVNNFLHALLVWPIFFASLLLLYFTPPLFHIASPLGLPLVLNLGFGFAAVHALFYLFLNRCAGSLAALLCAISWIGSSIVGRQLGFPLSWKVALGVQIFGWSGQLVGHKVFEGESQALLDSLFQTVVMTPFFVLLEALQRFFSYEPYPGFHAKVQAKVDAELRAIKQKKKSS